MRFPIRYPLNSKHIHLGLVNDPLSLQCDREPATIPPFHTWTIYCTVRPLMMNSIGPDFPHTASISMNRYISISKWTALDCIIPVIHTSFVIFCAFGQSGFCTRGRRFCKTSARMVSARAMFGPSSTV